MNIIEKNIDEILPYAGNPRRNDAAVETVRKSIEEFGFINPIVVDRNMVIIAGHTRLKAAEAMGMKKVPVIIAENLTEEQSKMFRIVDNRSAEIAEWDEELLQIELTQLQEVVDAPKLEDLGLTLEDFGLENAEGGGAVRERDGSGAGILFEKFLIPPFSILDTRKGDWQERKRLWQSYIQDDGSSRGKGKLYNDSISKKIGLSSISVLDAVLAEIVVNWFSPKEENGKNCFDVFAGDTVFGFVSSFLGKHFTGIELRKEQADFNNSRAQEYKLDATYINDDGRNVLQHIKEESQDLLFSCPPYFDLEVYSDLPNDASNQSTYEDFYAILDKAFTDAIKCLKPNRFAVIVVGDIRNKNGGYYGFPDDIKKTFTREGMMVYNEMILVNVVASASVRANNYMKNRKVAKVHQNVLVFYKGDPKKIQEEFGECKVADFDDGEELLDES